MQRTLTLLFSLVILFFSSCVKEGKIKIRTESVEVEGRKLIHFWCESDVKLYDYRWSIVGMDTVFSKNDEADFYFQKSGLYKIELRAIGIRTHKDFLTLRVKGIEGELNGWWGIAGGHRYNISLWVKGFKEDGTAYRDSMYKDSQPPSMWQEAPCMANGVKLVLPAGKYKYYYRYNRDNPSGTLVADSADCEMDGNCINVFN